MLPRSTQIFEKKNGLFKTEHESEKIVALGSKSYFCHNSSGKCKQVAKGVSLLQNRLTFDQYHEVLTSTKGLTFTNRGFQTRNHQMYSYTKKKGD